MLRNYFLTAWRNLAKHRLTAGINVIGLSAAFMCALLLFLMVHREFSVDGFHKNNASLFELYSLSHAPGGDERGASMGYPVAPAMKSEVQGIVKATGLMDAGVGIRYKNKEMDKNIAVVDNDFFQMFSFPVLSGERVNPLSGTGDVVISQSTADAVFGKEDPVGKVVKVKIGDDWKDLAVTAVLKDAPENSSIQYDVLARIEINGDYSRSKNLWNYQNHRVFVQTAPGVTPMKVETALREVVKKHQVVDQESLKSRGYHPDSNGESFFYKLASFPSLHFSEDLGIGTTISKTYLYTLTLIALVVLAIACFNFINLNVARAFTRAKEVGIRKTIGAGKKQIFLQLWTESLLLCLIAFFIGIIAATNLLLPFNDLFREKLHMKELMNPGVLATVILGLLLVSFLAGGYPAMLISRYNPISVLKGKISVNRSAVLRNGLITFQFLLSSLLICSTIVIYRQFQFLRTAPLGYEQESVISIPVKKMENTRRYIDQLRTRLSGQPQVVSVTGSSSNIGIGMDFGESRWNEGFMYHGNVIMTALMAVDYDYFSTLGIKPLAGRDFSRDYASDSSSAANNVVITESMSKQLGEKNIVGLSFFTDSSQPKWNIIGVIPDIHLYSMYEKPVSFTFRMAKKVPMSYILVKVRTTNPMQSMDLVSRTYRELEPGNSVIPSYLSENTRRWYEKERRLASIFFSAAAIAIILSCLGLFAIVSLVLEQRRKEIGVRKVLGASLAGITGLLSRDFLKLIVWAFIIAIPIAWYSLNHWLEGFVYRTSISWWVFPVAGLLSVAIALLTICFQTVKASLANPIESLRTE